MKPPQPFTLVSLEPALITREQAARFLAVSERSFDELVRRGAVRPIRIPQMRRVAFAVDDLRKLVTVWRGQSGPDVDATSVLSDSLQP